MSHPSCLSSSNSRPFCNLFNTTSSNTLPMQLILSIFLQTHVSNTPRSLSSFSLRIHVSAAKSATLQTRLLTRIFLCDSTKLPVNSFLFLLNAPLPSAIMYFLPLLLTMLSRGAVHWSSILVRNSCCTPFLKMKPFVFFTLIFIYWPDSPYQAVSKLFQTSFWATH